jgi:predicted metalloprotease with PDZ domain
MEHRNSTIISSGAPLSATNMLALLGTLVHEHFHAWNMERLRDRALEPFNFENADMSPNLWFGEGFTQYYTPLIPKRAGYTDLAAYARSLGGTISQVVNSPGRSHNSPVQMSQYAPFADAAVSNDLTNQQNIFISYYTYGSAIGLGLDLTLRTRFDKTLDGYMRALWAKYGSKQANYTPLRPYTTADLRATLGEYTGDVAFANDFFARYIEGKEAIDYAPLLAHAGLLLRRANTTRPTLGPAPFRFDSTGATVAAPTAEGSAFHVAGIENGDRITEVDGNPFNNAAALQTLIAAHKVGDEVPVSFVQRGMAKRATLRFQDDPRLEVVTYEDAGMQVTPAMTAFRNAWTGTQVK